MDPDPLSALLLIFGAILLVLLLSGFCSGAEAALLSISDAEVETGMRRKLPGYAMLARVKHSLNRSIIALVILNNIVNIAGSIAVGQLVTKIYGSAALAVTTSILTFAVIFFAEITPKSLGIHYAPRIAPTVALPTYLLSVVLLPLILVLEAIMNAFKHGERKIGTEDQIRSLVAIGRRAGHIESDEHQLIHRAFVLNDRTAADVMMPLKKIVSVRDNATVRQAATKVFHETFSRYPVFGESPNVVKGLLLSQDILEQLSSCRDNDPITEIIRPVLTVSAQQPCDDLLVLFRDKKIHLAIVKEKNKTVGLVTLEDVLEELVGEIEDEIDADNAAK